MNTSPPKPKRFPCSGPGCNALVAGGSLCERHVGEVSIAYRVCPCGREGITKPMADVCERCEDEAWEHWDDCWE